MSVSFKDFQPVNNWKVDHDGEKYRCCAQHAEQPKFIIDESTNRKYSNDSPNVVRFKCFLLILGTPIVHPTASFVNVAYRIMKLATLSHFWENNEEKKYNFKARIVHAGTDLLIIVGTLFSLAGLELAAIYGLFRPYDGRKLYATIERATYGNFVLAPCFQPEPTCHALGGDINQKDAF